MRVKVGDRWFDSDDTPICVEFTDEDKERIRGMPGSCYKYAAFPDTSDTARIEAWMKDDTTGNPKPTEGA